MIRGLLLRADREPEAVEEPHWDAGTVGRRLGSWVFSFVQIRPQGGDDLELRAFFPGVRRFRPPIVFEPQSPCLVLGLRDGEPEHLPVQDILGLATVLVAHEYGIPLIYPRRELSGA